VRTLGGKLGRVLIIGCKVDDANERIGLSRSVEGAVDEAIRVILELIGQSREPEIRKEA
jgi:hydrogenase maturation protease